VIVDESDKAVGPIVDGDAVVTFNFRADRMVMLAKALEYADFDKFDRVGVPKIRYAGMLQYDGELLLPKRYLVSPPEIDRTSGEYLVKNGIRTFACRQVYDFQNSFLLMQYFSENSIPKHLLPINALRHITHYFRLLLFIKNN
jgi:2,3-bisphosphoglycerate-independent phosphoglycerate mutase